MGYVVCAASTHSARARGGPHIVSYLGQMACLYWLYLLSSLWFVHAKVLASQITELFLRFGIYHTDHPLSKEAAFR